MLYLPSFLKRCTKCGEWLLQSSFGFQKRTKDGLRHWCKKCHREYSHYDPINRKQYLKQYRQEHRDHRCKYNRQYRHTHNSEPERRKIRERRREYMKQYHVEHRQKKIASASQWARANPDKARARSIKYHRRHQIDPRYRSMKQATYNRYMARRRGLVDNFTNQDWIDCLGWWHGVCAYCGNPPGLFPGMELTADHFIPLNDPRCPGTVPDNIVPACKSCNSSKRDKDPCEWINDKFGRNKSRQVLKRIKAYFEDRKVVE